MEKLQLSLDRGQTLLDGLLKTGVALNHDCGGRLACATCLVLVRHGFERLNPAGEEEQDILARAATEPQTRLACQAVGAGGEFVIEVPAAEIIRPASEPLHASPLPIVLSERAAKHVAAQLAKRSDALALRIAVERAGCSGLRYRFERASAIGSHDAVFESAGIRITVDRTSLSYVHGATVDLVEEGLTRRLRLQNPNARESCGCGESFAVSPS
jgi:iron-sulfur cluster assembly protein